MLYFAMKPIKLYKYRRINKHLIDSLVNSSIFFACPDALNDPFDCRVNIKNSISNAANSLSGASSKKLIALLKDEEFFKILQKDLNCFGICAFAGSLNCDPREVLMWTHYADNHRGVCIKYEFSEDIVEQEKEIAGISNVSYEQEAMINWFKSPETLSMDFDSVDFIMELAKQMLVVKSPPWGYEAEIRIIRSKSGELKIPKPFIKGICFGLETPHNDITLINNILTKFYSKIERYKMIRTKNDFGFDIEKI